LSEERERMMDEGRRVEGTEEKEREYQCSSS